MCKAKTPTYQATPVQQVATPTYADAEVTKTSSNQRRRFAGLGNRNIRTSARGLEDAALTDKRKLLGE